MANYSYLADGTKAEALAADGTGLVYRGSLIYRKGSVGSLSLESAITPAGRITPASVRHHVTDHLGSVVAVVDGVTGSLYEAGEYGVYGARSSVSGISLITLPAGETLRDHFTGKEDQGPDFGLPYTDFGARHYSPALRRWLVPDPLAEEYYDVSPFVYCDGNPVMMVDEDGKSPIGGIVKGAKVARKAYKVSKTAKKIRAGAFLINEAYGYYDDVTTLFNSESSWAEKGLAVIDLATGFGSEAKTAGTALGIKSLAESSFRSFKKWNFRHNLGVLTGGIKDGMDAHHVIPKKFEGRIKNMSIDINIHDPKYGYWLDIHEHRSTSKIYNEKWEHYFYECKINGITPTAEDLEEKAKLFMQELYGVTLLFGK